MMHHGVCVQELFSLLLASGHMFGSAMSEEGSCMHSRLLLRLDLLQYVHLPIHSHPMQ